MIRVSKASALRTAARVKTVKGPLESTAVGLAVCMVLLQDYQVMGHYSKKNLRGHLIYHCHFTNRNLMPRKKLKDAIIMEQKYNIMKTFNYKTWLNLCLMVLLILFSVCENVVVCKITEKKQNTLNSFEELLKKNSALWLYFSFKNFNRNIIGYSHSKRINLRVLLSIVFSQ